MPAPRTGALRPRDCLLPGVDELAASNSAAAVRRRRGVVAPGGCRAPADVGTEAARRGLRNHPCRHRNRLARMDRGLADRATFVSSRAGLGRTSSPGAASLSTVHVSAWWTRSTRGRGLDLTEKHYFHIGIARRALAAKGLGEHPRHSPRSPASTGESAASAFCNSACRSSPRCPRGYDLGPPRPAPPRRALAPPAAWAGDPQAFVIVSKRCGSIAGLLSREMRRWRPDARTAHSRQRRLRCNWATAYTDGPASHHT